MTGAAYALLALDCAGDTFQSSQREAYVKYILDAQRKDGGWDLRGESAAAADADVTAICLQALAAYAGDPAVRPAVNKGLQPRGRTGLSRPGPEAPGEILRAAPGPAAVQAVADDGGLRPLFPDRPLLPR